MEAIDLEVCPGANALLVRRACVGRSRRSRENSRERKLLGRAIRKALEPIEDVLWRAGMSMSNADVLRHAVESIALTERQRAPFAVENGWCGHGPTSGRYRYPDINAPAVWECFGCSMVARKAITPSPAR